MTRLVCIAALLLLRTTAAEAGTLLLKNSWITAHKNRVTVDVDCRVDQALKQPHNIASGGDDGDLHMAGRCDVGLPMVLEIVNAALFPGAVSAVQSAASSKDVQHIDGAWRLWFEHPAQATQTQGAKVPVPTDSNPDHVFEIHPLTAFAGDDVRPGFEPIKGYKAYDAKTAFTYYEQRKFTAVRQATFTSITATKAVYNYAAFPLTVAGPPQKVADGFMVLATIDGVVNDLRRMVIADGTPPAALIQHATTGSRFVALGIPRVSLERIDAQTLKNPGKKVVVPAAYEMIIVALTPK
jgi:hypothetical protein